MNLQICAVLPLTPLNYIQASFHFYAMLSMQKKTYRHILLKKFSQN